MYLNEYFNFEKLMNELRTFDNTFLTKLPTKLTPFSGNHSVEKGIDEDGRWEKSTYKTDNGLVSYTYYTKTYTPTKPYAPTKPGTTNNTTETTNNTTEWSTNKTDYTWELKNELQTAINEQDFETAVVLRDKIKQVEKNTTKLNQLESELSETIKSQDFEKSIELRDKINKLKK